MPENDTEAVHYHLSANVKFDKKNAFNGETTVEGHPSFDNFNIKEFSVKIKSKETRKFINPVSYELMSYINPDIDGSSNKKIMINNNFYKLAKINNRDNLEIFNCKDIIDGKSNKFYFSCGKSEDDKANIDKTYSGITSNIFSKKNQFYHGGSKSGYDARKIVKNKSFTLFYTKDNIADINNENSILIGLGEIQNKIGILDTSDRIEGSKIYCYNHYENEKYYPFRFPYNELINIKNAQGDAKNAAKQFLEELIEPLSIENSDKAFFKEKSYVITAAIVLKYANRLYEQIMKLKQNKTLWKAVKNASETKWHFCDDISIGFLKDSINKLREAQLNQKNPGLWALKEYFQINSGNENEYENFLKMCAGEKDLDDNLVLFNADDENIKKFILEHLIKYPIANKKTIQRIFTHLGLEAVYNIKNSPQNISTDLSELSELSELINKVNNNKDLYEENIVCKYNDFYHRKNSLNKVLKAKNGFSLDKNLLTNDNNQIKLDEGKAIINLKIISTNAIINKDNLLTNPYLLFEKYIQNDDAPLLLDDIDWGQKIIQKDNFKVDNKFRLRAIIVEYIKKQENQTGHVWVSYEDAQEYLNDRLFELDDKLDKFYKISDFWDIEIFEYDDKKKFLTLKEFANRETYINSFISGLINSSHSNQNVILEKLEERRQKDPDKKFIESELSLLKMQELNFVFISGVAGSGKSHTLCKYLDYLCGGEEENKPIDPNDFQVLTPSGKAANVIKNKIKENKENFPNIFKYFYNDDQTEKVEEEAEDPKKNILFTRRVSTADRYIVDSKKFWRQDLFARVDDGSVPDKSIDVLIIDEISMITLDTLYYILKIKNPKKLIILGDIKQLPPIGYGSLATSIYNHLFLESSFQDICLAKMETSHRADDNSQFIKHSLTLRDKEKQLKKEDLNNNGNFILIPYSNEQNNNIGTNIKTIYKIEGEKDNFLENIKEKNKDIQILTPNRIGESGTYAINEIFKNALVDREAKKGLKFIYNKNDKETGLSNGTMGYYEQATEENKETKQKDKINFDGIKVDYSEYNENYELGFAITVHKSQGSGFPIVILVLPEKNNSLITKELIYTALTRPEEKMYILYHKDNIKALTHLPSIPHRNMNLFHRDKLFWIKDEIEYPITYKDIDYRRKQDLYFALMLEYSDFNMLKEKNVESNETKKENEEAKKIVVNYHKNGAFVWSEKVEKLLMPKFYIKEKQDEKSFKYLKSIDLQEVYENFKFKLGGVEYEKLSKRNNENKKDIIVDNNDSIEIITHNGLRTRSWSEAILMLIFDKLEIPYFYEVEIRREDAKNTYKLTYPKPDNNDYRIPDFTISSEKNGTFPEKGKEGTEEIVEINKVKCIIEHLGMLTNDSYKRGWKEKVKDYKNNYKFEIIAPISSLTKQKDKYFVSEIWEIDNDKPTEQQKSEILIDKKICFTTDEEDLKDIQKLINQLTLLKEFYSLKQESK